MMYLIKINYILLNKTNTRKSDPDQSRSIMITLQQRVKNVFTPRLHKEDYFYKKKFFNYTGIFA